MRVKSNKGNLNQLSSKYSVTITNNTRKSKPKQGSQNFKIPGSPSGRYSSDFGNPKINLTSPNKTNKKLFFKYRKSDRSPNVNQKYFQYTYQQI